MREHWEWFLALAALGGVSVLVNWVGWLCGALFVSLLFCRTWGKVEGAIDDSERARRDAMQERLRRKHHPEDEP